MSLQQELNSWMSPTPRETAPTPTIGSKAPSSSNLQVPRPDGKPAIITFLRHCGCPFAEKTFMRLRYLANRHPEIDFIAVSHSSQEATDKWAIEIGGEWDVNVIIDPERELYAQWGLGVSSAWHVLNPWSMYSVYQLGKKEHIWNRPTESGTRWQTAGSFAVDKDGIVRWVRIAKSADDVPMFKEGMEALKENESLEAKA